MPNERPTDVTDLLIEGTVDDLWMAENSEKNRFFLVNIRPVIGLIGLRENQYKEYFAAASKEIAEHTTWPDDYSFSYKAHHSHINRNVYNKPKRFGLAATTIVAFELAAKQRRPNLNVYDWLRIQAGDYFVDRFHARKLVALKEHYDKMTPSERDTVFAPHGGQQFEEMFLAHIGQEGRDGLLKQIALGATATEHTCTKIFNFVNQTFALRDDSLVVGPVRTAGDIQRRHTELGTGNASNLLRTRENWPTDELPPCPAVNNAGAAATA